MPVGCWRFVFSLRRLPKEWTKEFSDGLRGDRWTQRKRRRGGGRLSKKMSGLFDLGSREEGEAIIAVLLHGTIKFIP